MVVNNLIFIPIKKEILEKKNYLLQSLGLHLLIIMLIYYGLPNLFRYRAEFLPPLPVEIINITDKTTAPKINFKIAVMVLFPAPCPPDSPIILILLSFLYVE